jgi:hypothetical protein
MRSKDDEDESARVDVVRRARFDDLIFWLVVLDATAISRLILLVLPRCGKPTGQREWVS